MIKKTVDNSYVCSVLLCNDTHNFQTTQHYGGDMESGNENLSFLIKVASGSDSIRLKWLIGCLTEERSESTAAWVSAHGQQLSKLSK